VPKNYKNIQLPPELSEMVDQIKEDKKTLLGVTMTDKQVIESVLRFYMASHYSEVQDDSKQSNSK
jgi:hypothetical protein